MEPDRAGIRGAKGRRPFEDHRDGESQLMVISKIASGMLYGSKTEIEVKYTL